MPTEDASQNLKKLSQRERQVLGMVCDGFSYQEISAKLYISIPTVKTDMGRVYMKLGLKYSIKAERIREIHQIYCPLLKNYGVSPEPVPPEPASTQPESLETVPPEQLSAEAAPPEPVSHEPVPPEPMATEPVPTEPIPSEPVYFETNKQTKGEVPESSKPISPEPAPAEPMTPEPVSPQPESPKPVKPEKDSFETNEPVPGEVMDMVNEDEYEIVLVHPKEKEKPKEEPKKIIYVPETKKPDTGRRWPVLSIIVGVFVIACVCIGTILLGSRFIPGLFQNQPSASTQGMPPENTPVSNPTSAQLLPTDTPSIQVNPVVATNPPEPTTPPLPTAVIPSISLPFSDNFDNGANPAWNILSGTWITADGRYSISNADYQWAFSILDDPRWTDYRVKVNVVRSHPGAAVEGEEAIVVRYLSSQSKYLVFYLNTLEQAGWAFYDGKNFDFIAGHKSNSVPNQYDLEIDAVGNTFTAKINGMTVQQISTSGYANGGVGLGIQCRYTPCSSFKNFQVSSAP